MTKIFGVSLLALSALLFTDASMAETRSSTKVIRLERQIQLLQRQARREFRKLSSAEKIKVLRYKSDDSDRDGLADALETVSGRCLTDSDLDGINDGSEIISGGPVEIHSKITSLDSNALVVKGVLFQVDASTRLLGRDNETLTVSNFSVGECVEAEGTYTSATTAQASKIKKDDNC